MTAPPSTGHGGLPPSAWIRRWSHLVPAGASVLDVACGSGRHVRWFADRGCRVTGIDRDAAAVEPLHGLAEIVVADIEAGAWPLGTRRFDAVAVTNYLWRQGLPALVASLASGGTLLYETFAAGQETLGKPSNPAFLLQPGELLRVATSLRTVAYEDGFEAATTNTPARFVQRIAAVDVGARPGPSVHRSGPLLDGFARQLKSSDSEDPA